MKNESKKRKKKGFDTVKFFRKVKRQISKKLQTMTSEERVAYFNAVPPVIGTGHKKSK